MDPSATITPPIEDDSGYCLRVKDIEFLHIEDSAVRRAVSKECPLGMDVSTYLKFTGRLLKVLSLQGITDADIRIQGSSVRFFSGAHKVMPLSRTELADEYLAIRKAEPPNLSELVDIVRTQWPEDGPRPARRIFDVMYRLGIDPQQSDYDVQISSNQLLDRIGEKLALKDVDVTQMKINHPTYDFVRKELVDVYLPFLSQWIDIAIALVERPVSLAVFGSDGPKELKDNPALSSHHKPGDWIVTSKTGVAL